MRIGIYARVSTKDQSCELQLRDLRACGQARGFDLVREYIDVGQSGATDSRPQLNILMGDARKRQFDAVVVWRFDRFARSTKHLLSALEEFRSLNIQFISYQENMDTSTSLGQALFTIVPTVAQLERDLIRERVSAGIRNARANGKKLCRPTSGVDREQVMTLKAQAKACDRLPRIFEWVMGRCAHGSPPWPKVDQGKTYPGSAGFLCRRFWTVRRRAEGHSHYFRIADHPLRVGLIQRDPWESWLNCLTIIAATATDQRNEARASRCNM